MTRLGFVGGLLTALVGLSTGCDSTPAKAQAAAASAAPGASVVRRGDFERRVLLTGEVDAVGAVELKVPRVPNGKTPLRFLSPEGTEVKAGELVADLDSSSFVAEIKDRSLQLSQAEIDLQRQASQNGVIEADRALEVERKRAAMLRAEVDADVPEGILPKRDYLEKQLVLRRMKVDLDKALEALELARRSAQSDLAVKRISIEKLRRAMTDAEQSVLLLTLKAPVAGTVIVAEHPEERRKLQEGDDVFMGMTVVRVTNSSARRVRAQLLDVDDGKIAAGMPARVVLDAYPDRSFSAQVRDIAPMARTPDNSRGAQRRIFAVNVDLNDAEAAVLRPGLSARVEVQVERRTGVLLAPRTAIDWIEGEGRVRVVGKGLVPVKLGGCNRDVCVIEEGLAEGTAVGGAAS